MTIINNSPFYGATGNLPGFSARSVNTLNNLDSDINIITGNGLSLGVSGSSISLTNTGVRLINGLSGAIDLVAGTAVNFNIVGNTLTINSSDIILPGASYSIGGAGILITQTPGSSAATISNIGVLSYNGITGNIEGVSGAIAGAGISLSAATGAVIISNSGVLSFNGNTGAVAGASLGANTFTGAQTASSGFVGPLTGLASNASALGGTAAADWVLKKDSVSSFNGNTGAVAGASLGANIFTLLNTFNAGISASGATFTGNITAPNIVASFNGNTGAVAGASLGANTFTLLNTFNAGISASGATFTGNITAPNIVASFNGVTGAVGISAGSNVTIEKTGNTYTINAILSGSGAATNVANTFTLLNTFNAGISATGATFPGNITISSSGFSGPLGGTASNASALGGTAAANWTLKKDSVASFNGNTGAVAGASLGANTFTLLNTFDAGISASGATFPGNITISSSGFSGPLGGTASNASALGGTAAANWTLKKDSVAKITASTGISITPSGGTGDITISNTGVQSISAGTGISINQGVGAVTINSTGNFNENILFSGTKQGLVGLYDPTKTQAIWAIGASYTLGTDTSSTNYGTHYGLAWSYEPDYITVGNNPQSKAGLSHQLLIQNNGTTRTAIGIGIWTEGTITAGGFNGIVLPASGVAQQIHFGAGGEPALPNSIQFPTVDALPYSIYREGGTWTTPYPDLVISYHTGIKLIAHESYGGTRFYSHYLAGHQADDKILLSVGNGDLHVRVGSSTNTTSNLIAYGKVGIGTVSPTVALDIAGEAQSSTSTTSESNAKTLTTKDYVDTVTSNASALGGTASSFWTLKKDSVASFNGVTGAVGISAGSNITIDKTGNTYTINAILSGSGAATNVANTFTELNTFNKGISATGATFPGNITISSSGFSGPLVGTASNASALGGTAAADWVLKKDSVSSFNGNTGAVAGASLGANTFTGLNKFAAGISATTGIFTSSISAPNIVASFNGKTGAVGISAGSNVTIAQSGNASTGFTYTINAILPASGAVTSSANTFTALNTFNAGISANTILSESYKVSKDAVNIQTVTSYALQMSDNGKIITCNNASPITVTLPIGVDNTRFTCTVIQLGDGVVQFAVASANETMTSYLGKTKLAGKYASAIILNIASITSLKQYVITGNLSY